MEGDEVSEAERKKKGYGTQQKEGVKGHAGKIKKVKIKKGVWKEKKQSQSSGTSSTNKGKGKGNSGCGNY